MRITLERAKGYRIIPTKLLVVDYLQAYNTILGRLILNVLEAIIST